MTEWKEQPALGVILAKIVELHARVVRLDAKDRENRTKRLLAVAQKATR